MHSPCFCCCFWWGLYIFLWVKNWRLDWSYHKDSKKAKKSKLWRANFANSHVLEIFRCLEKVFLNALYIYFCCGWFSWGRNIVNPYKIKIPDFSYQKDSKTLKKLKICRAIHENFYLLLLVKVMMLTALIFLDLKKNEWTYSFSCDYFKTVQILQFCRAKFENSLLPGKPVKWNSQFREPLLTLLVVFMTSLFFL